MYSLNFPLCAALGMALALFSGPVPLQAADCGNSFYCYGNTARTVVRVATRPPPIPPPNRQRMQYRNRVQLAARTTPPVPRSVRPVTRSSPARVPVVRAASRCEVWQSRVATLESQAVMAAKKGQHGQAKNLFQQAAQLRRQGCGGLE